MESLADKRIKNEETQFAEEFRERIEAFPEGTVFTHELISGILDSLIYGEDPPVRTPAGWDFSEVKKARVLIEGTGLLLRPLAEADRDFYLRVYKQHSEFDHLFDLNPSFYDDIWKSVCTCDTFYCVIELEMAEMPIGYIGLKDTKVFPWEIAIELDDEYCGHGYGPESIRHFLKAVTELTGVTEYQAIVEADNIRSQKCMENLGAELKGLKLGSFMKNDTLREQFEKTNLNMINEHMTELANRLHTEARHLLSHNLDYRFHTAVGA